MRMILSASMIQGDDVPDEDGYVGVMLSVRGKVRADRVNELIAIISGSEIKLKAVDGKVRDKDKAKDDDDDDDDGRADSDGDGDGGRRFCSCGIDMVLRDGEWLCPGCEAERLSRLWKGEFE